MSIKWFSSKKLNNTEQSQDLQRTCKPWLSVFMMVFTALLTIGFVRFKDDILLATIYEPNVSYSLNSIKPKSNSHTTVKVSDRTIKNGAKYSPNYQFTSDTGYKLLLLSFQPKETYQISDSLETTIDDEYSKDMYLLSGYTITSKFEDLGYRDGINWANLGKIYTEYGTLGLTGVNGENKQFLIKDIIEKDFPDAELDTISNIELLNGLAYRSNIITTGLIGRSLVYVPRDAAVFDTTLDKSSSYWTSHKDEAVQMAPFMYGLLNKNAAIAFSSKFRSGVSKLDAFKFNDNYKSLADAMLTAFDASKTYEQKQTAAQYMQNAVSFAWPLLVNSTDATTEQFGPLMNVSKVPLVGNQVEIAPLNPAVNISTKDEEKYWTSPFASGAYYVEDTLHKNSASEDTYLKTVTALLDTDEEFLKKYKTEALNEEQLHEDLMKYYEKHPDMAYAVLDAVFGNIKEYPVLINDKHSMSESDINRLAHYKYTIGHTSYIDFEERMVNWLKAGIDNYDEKDAKREVRVAGIRQAELNCALGFILQERHAGINVDTHSNIEIRLIDVYSNQGMINPNGVIDEKNNYTGKDYIDELAAKISEQGWGAWDLILGLPNTAYCTTYETIASNFYDYNELSSNKTKVTTLASASLMYAKNHKFGIPTSDGKELISGGQVVVQDTQTPNDLVLNALNSIGRRNFYITAKKDWDSDTKVLHSISTGIDYNYEKSFNTNKELANLALTDMIRQSYMCTLYSRGKSAVGNLDLLYNYVGLINFGFMRDTHSSYVAFTGFLPGQMGMRDMSGIGSGKYYAKDLVHKVGMSRYTISFNTTLPEKESYVTYVELPFNGKKIKLSSSKLANVHANSKWITKWDTSQTFATAAGSFVLRTAEKSNPAFLIVGYDDNNGSDYEIDTIYSTIGSSKLNDDQPAPTYTSSGDRLSTNNWAASYLYKMAFSTYSPSADTIGILNEEEDEDTILRAQDLTVCANGYFNYLYNRCYYQESDTIEVHAVLGFREKDSTDLEVTHECSPTEIDNYNMVLGVNLSKGALEALNENLIDDNCTAKLTVALGGTFSDGKLIYFSQDGTEAIASEFDASLLTENDKNVLSKSGFGQLKTYLNDWPSSSINSLVKKQDYVKWGNRTEGNYVAQKLPNNVSKEKGLLVTVEISKAQLEEWLSDDKYSESDTFHTSDTEFMLVVKEWSADFFAGEKGNRLATVDSDGKLALNHDYTFGVECQLAVEKVLDDSSSKLTLIPVYDTGEIDSEDYHYVTLGSGIYSGLYSSSAVGGNNVRVLAIRDKELMPDELESQKDYIFSNTAYGEGTDNHVYFRFAQSEVKQWQFKGKAMLRWVNSEHPKLAQVNSDESKILNDTITSTMSFEFDGGKTTIKELYDTLKEEGVKYIVVSIAENSLKTEGSYDSPNKKETTGEDLIGDLRELKEGSKGMTDALQHFNHGSVVYTLDEFIEFLGGKESTDTNGNFKITNKYINTHTAALEGNNPTSGGEATSSEFDANRLEFSFIASVYGTGDDETLANAVKNDDRKVDEYLGTVINNDKVPMFDLTNGLAYVLNPMSSSDFANSKDNVRYTAAMNKELANLKLAKPDDNIKAEDTKLYALLADNKDIIVWTHQESKEGSSYQVKNAAAFEGLGLRDKLTATISLGDDKKPGGDAWVAAIFKDIGITPQGKTYIVRTSAPIAYTQLKNGSWTDTTTAEQTWNTLAGIPSTETFYVSSGGSEFIIEMTASDVVHERAYRSYISHFAQNDCKFKPGDIASAGGGTVTSVTKSNISHTLNVTSSVGNLTDKFSLPAPVGYSSASYTVSAHGGNTITATWTGTIENTTANPGIQHTTAPVDMIGALSSASAVQVKTTGNGYTYSTSVGPGGWFSGYPGEMTNSSHPNKQHLAGTAGGDYSWNVTNYNKAVDQAYTWAKALETASDGAGNVIITSNSDQKVRSWHIGDAVINITLTNVNSATNAGAKVTFAHEGKGLPKTTYTTDDVTKMAYTGGGGGAKLETNDDTLSSGWFEVYGSKEQFNGASSCNSSHSAVTGQTGRATVSWGDESALNTWQSQGHPQQIPYSYISSYNQSHTAASGETPCGGDSCTPVTTDSTYPEEFWCSNNPGSWVDAEHTHNANSETVDGPGADGCPGHGTDEEGNPNECTCTHTVYSCDHEVIAGKAANTHTCSASHSTSGYKETTLKQSGTVSYKIVVTFKDSYTQGEQKVTTPGGTYPKHSCCGPCCEHVLPAISDEWVQWISYKTVRISDIRVNKISKSYVEGQNELTLELKEEPYLKGDIQQGDVNVFYNIATENPVYKKSIYTDRDGYINGYSTMPIDSDDEGYYSVIDGASLAGRIRYSVQAQQHDKVLWQEYNQLNQVKRTSECDGQDSTVIKNGSSIDTAKYNPTPDGGQGHDEEWALGILYRRSNSASDVYYVASARNEEQYNTKFTHADGWLSGNGNGDFNTAVIQSASSKTGYTNNSVDERDKATWEYNRFIMRRETINTVQVMTDTLILQGTQNGDRPILYKASTSAGKTTQQDHTYKDDGLQMSVDTLFPSAPRLPIKYDYAGQTGPTNPTKVTYHVLENISSPNSIAFGGYNGRGWDDNLNTHTAFGNSVQTTTYLDSNGSVFDATASHPDPYASVAAPMTYAKIYTLDNDTNPNLFKSSAALYQQRIDRPTAPLRIGKLDIQIDPTMQNQLHDTEKATQTWFQIIKYTEPNSKGANYNVALDKENFAPSKTFENVKVFTQESYYYGNSYNGWLDTMYKVNDIVVHSPISSTNNYLLQDVDFYDQRIDFTNLSHDNNTKGCPSSSLLCEHSYFDCSYLEEKVLFNMDFDPTYSRVDSHGNVNTGKTFAVDTYGYITTITETANFTVVPVKAGLVTRINTAEHGTGINVNGTKLNIPLETIGAQYTTGTKLKLVMHGSFSANTSVFKCGNVTATMISNGLTISNGKAAYVFNFNNATAYHTYELIIDYDGLDKFTLKVDGKNVNKAASTPAPDDLNVQFNASMWSDTMAIGERCKLYSLQLSHLPGTTTCTDGCYDNKFECQEVWNYTCDTATKFTGTSLPHKYTATIEGTYLIELYDGAGNYQSQKIHLDKGESIYAYLGSKGYWSYSGTDKGSTSTTKKEFVDHQVGVENATIINPPTTILDKTTGNGSTTLVPGVYYLETEGKQGKVSGYYTVTNNTTLYYGVGEESWINTSNSKTNAIVNSGTPGVPGKPAVPGSHTHTSSCPQKIGSYSPSYTPGYTALSVYYYESGGHCTCGSGYSTYRYYCLSQGEAAFGSTLIASGICTNGCSSGSSHTGGSGTCTIYVQYTYACNDLPLNTGGTAAVPEVPAKAGYAASTVENVVITSNTGATTVKQATLNIGSAYSSGTGTSYTITNYASSKRLTTDDNASWYNSSRNDSPSTDYYTCPLYGNYGGYYWANKTGSNNRYYASDQTYTFNEESGYGGVIDMRFTTGCLTGNLTLTNFKPILVKKDGTVVTGLIDTLIAQGYITAKCAYSNAGSYTPFATPANIFNGSSLGSNNWASIAFAFELSDEVKMTGFSANCSTYSKPGDCYSAVHYADAQVQEFETSVKILKYVDLSSYTDISNVENTYTNALITDKINVTPLSPTQVVFNNNTNSTTTIEPGIYLLEAIDEDGKGATGIYHTLTTKTLYHGNSEAGHWINTTNNATAPLVSAKKGTDAVYEYTDMTRSAYNDDGGDGYNCKMTASLTEGTYILCNGTYSAMRQMTTYKDGDYLGSISCTFTYKINGTTYYMYGAGSVSITVPAGQTWTVTCSTNDSSATAQSIDPYTAVFKAGTKTLVTPAVPGTYSANSVKAPNTSYTSTDSARTRVTKLASLSGYTNVTEVTYDTPTTTSVANIVITCKVPGKVLTNCKVTCITEVKVPITFTNYTYQADTSKIVLSNAGGAPIVLEYTGNVQAVTLEPGTYRLEAWGASGGGAGNGLAGEGGYTAGTVTFDKTTTLYVYVGQQGNGAVHGQYGTATFNGGGAGFRNGADSITHNGTSGGGATDIRVTDGIWYNEASLKSRILVAGGGGGYGCASSHNPGHGGGLTGATTLNPSGSYAGASAGGGSQTAPGKGVGNWAAAYGYGEGKFGIGATGEQCAAGGGGGYYGGGTEYTAGGGGGSSYVSGYAGCDTTYLANQKVNGSNVTFRDVTLQQGGHIGNGRVRITKIGVASTAKYETSVSDGYTWVKVFAHDTNGGYFNTSTVLHTGTPASLRYSILDEIDMLRTAHDNKYVFKLYYPETGQTNIWKQSYKPQDENLPNGDGTKDVTGYEPIRIDMNNNYWGGLAKSTTSATFIDGSINHGNWYYAIGAVQAWPSGSTTPGDTIPGGGSQPEITKVELWLATDLTKVNKAAGSNAGASGDHILNATVTTTTTCPVESPYYWFLMAQKTNVAQIRLVHDEHTAACTKVKNTNNYHTHVPGCFGGTPVYNYLLYAAQNNLPELDTLCKTYLGVGKASLGNVYNTLINKSFNYTVVPETVDGHDNPILNCYNHYTEHVHTFTCSVNNRTSICNNIHHKGEHYDFGHPLCYEPCKDNEKHNPTKVQIDDESLYIGSAMNLNGYFNVYWDNYGNFYDTGDVGSAIPTSEKGQGYVDNMDTTRWLKRKVIIFNDIDVLFYDETQDTWTLYKAGEEISLPIVTDGIVGNGDDDEKRDWRSEEQNPVTVYPFYCLLNNNEYSRTAFQAWTEGLNSPGSEGQGDKPYDKLTDRYYDETATSTNFYRNGNNSLPPFSALHSTKHYHLFDVVGQIGNMVITYTTDPRWSNFFKQANPAAGWQVENLLYEVVPDDQERYLYIGREQNGKFKDIRNHEITSTNLFFDTWNNEAWKHTAVPINSILEPDLLAKQTSYVWSKLADDLKCGYDIYCEVTTTGDYTSLDVEYKYYVFDKDTGEVSEVDLWSKVDSSYLAYYLAEEDAAQIQQIIDQDSLGGYYGIESTKSLALYHLYVDLATEHKLRMITPAQILETSTLSKELDKTIQYTEIPEVNEDGELVYVSVGTEVDGPGLSLEQLNIGTAYGVTVDARSRILTGSSYDNWGLRDYSKGIVNFTYPRKIMDTNIGGQIISSDFTTQARRWIFTAGLAENTVAVKFDGTTHVDLTTQSTHENIITDYDRYAILIGVNIKARGDVWYLNYEAYNSAQRVLGKNLDTKYPDIIAVYGLSSKEDDFDVEQSH